MASSEFAKCELCGSRHWFTEDEKFPRYCEKCKKLPKITTDEQLDIHDDLKRMISWNISSERI